MTTPGPQAGGRQCTPNAPRQCFGSFLPLGSGASGFGLVCLARPKGVASCFLQTELPERIAGGWNLNFRSTASKGLVCVCPQICMGHTLNKYPAIYLKFEFIWHPEQGARGDPVRKACTCADDRAGRGEQDCGRPSAQKVHLGPGPEGRTSCPGPECTVGWLWPAPGGAGGGGSRRPGACRAARQRKDWQQAGLGAVPRVVEPGPGTPKAAASGEVRRATQWAPESPPNHLAVQDALSTPAQPPLS